MIRWTNKDLSLCRIQMYSPTEIGTRCENYSCQIRMATTTSAPDTATLLRRHSAMSSRRTEFRAVPEEDLEQEQWTNVKQSVTGICTRFRFLLNGWRTRLLLHYQAVSDWSKSPPTGTSTTSHRVNRKEHRRKRAAQRKSSSNFHPAL